MMKSESTVTHPMLQKSPHDLKTVLNDLQARYLYPCRGFTSDNASFSIDDDQLKLVDSLNFEANLSIRYG